MKITFVLPGGGTSGGVRCTVVACNRLLDRGHQVRLFYKQSLVTPKSVARSFWHKLWYKGCYNWIEMFKGTKIAYKDINDIHFSPDEIIVAAGMECSAQLDVFSDLSNPKLQYSHGLTPWIPEVTKKALSLDIPKIAVSSSIVEQAKSVSKGEFLAVVPNGIDPNEYFPDNSRNRRNGIGTIFSDHSAKDPKTILSVLELLRGKLPNTPQYIFGSSRRPREITSKSYAYFPTVAHARQKYSSSLVWFMASRWEGFSMPVLEAMACGCAVVATDCGGTRDIITHGENGFLVEVGDVSGIVDRVDELLKNEALRKKFVRKSQETVNSFSWENAIGKLESVLLKISEKQ